MSAFYNEHDPYAAQWLRNLISAGHIAPGIVDERDIRDITPSDLKRYAQCHFFAGIGVWSHALRRAGWPDERPIWTGSCPCQPFSAAGARAGFADERHLWPAFNHLIDQCRPPVVAGEQVENAGDWLDLVSADLEAQGYAVGAAFLPAAGFGGAHIRSRNYWMAHRLHAERGPVGINRKDGRDRTNYGRQEAYGDAGTRGEIYRLADPLDARLERHTRHGYHGDEPGRLGADEARPVAEAGNAGGLDDMHSTRRAGAQQDAEGDPRHEARLRLSGAGCRPDALDDATRPRAPMLGRNPADWLFCRDGKWRPVEPGTFPLVDAAPARVGRLRAYGNGLDAETATRFLEAVMDTLDGLDLV